ncbi:extracellular solute-binding protein (family 5) [Rhodococcus sp. SMB37]|uniref:ABC transporter substrate-binding protein n=1 Tax=Rhodococcus sp. SMB37 TaxID=2512213 RepID=UPI001046863C|nr:ABC transporter substrate-binding protein [Rhodococcus sp. SMB37]TCN57188.1 extracellular solute-binding protein (family 5) [Rhodococcus sp. SMB37]
MFRGRLSRTKRSIDAAAVAVCSVLMLSACGGSDSGSAGNDPAEVGEPVAGGVATVIQMGEPRTLDPAAMSNTYAGSSLLGNALYGTLMTTDVDTLEIEYGLATDFSSDDGGATMVLSLRPDVTFSDGTPLDAEAVKFNWDRLRDPDTASGSIGEASQIASTEVLDPMTLEVTLVAPNPNYAHSVIVSSMNWIASPDALQQGAASFDENPIGAGPFTLANWFRQDVIELEKNPNYWDAPRPYLDGLTLRASADTTQRLNSITTGGADLASDSNWSTLATAEDAGTAAEVVPMGGHDTEAAQQLFDELAAEGKPVSFTFTTFPTVENKAVAETTQAQLRAFDNVEVEVLDFPAAFARFGTRDFDMMVHGVTIQDPDHSLWSSFHSASEGNIVGIDDPDLDAALDAGRVGPTVDEREAAYAVVQERLAELIPGAWYVRPAPAVLIGDDMHGVRLSGLGAPIPDGMWLTG